MRGGNRFEFEPHHPGIAAEAKCCSPHSIMTVRGFVITRCLAEYLNKGWRQTAVLEIPELHGRAPFWYASHELWTEAVQHAIQPRF